MRGIERKWRTLVSVALFVVGCSRGPSTQSGSPRVLATNGPNAGSQKHETGDAPGEYLGRRLAEPMSYLGADWLERSDREATEQPEKALDALGLHEGETVADVGAGSGYLTERLSRRVGPTGHVIATDLQPEMLAMIRTKIRDRGLSNVETTLATESNANLPKHSVDVVLMVDVYHELPEPRATLAQIKEALKPGGVIALVEYRAEDPDVQIKEEHKMTLAQIKRELEASAFTIQRVDESLPQQRVVIAKPSLP